MTKEEIEKSKVIAEFMGGERLSEGSQNFARLKHWSIEPIGYFDDDELQYLTRWDWLMLVVEKIEALGFNFCNHQARTVIQVNDTGLISGYKDPDIEIRSSIVDFNKKKSYFEAVYEFIIWYNSIKK